MIVLFQVNIANFKSGFYLKPKKYDIYHNYISKIDYAVLAIMIRLSSRVNSSLYVLIICITSIIIITPYNIYLYTFSNYSSKQLFQSEY